MFQKIKIISENNDKRLINKKSYIIIKFFSNIIKLIKNKNIIILIFSIISAIFYILSLCNIRALDMKCYNKIGVECYYILAKLIFISCVFVSISIYLIFFKDFNKFNILIILIIYLFFFYIDHDDGVVKHGFFNIIAFIIVTFFLTTLLIMIHFFYYLLKTKKYFLFISILILIFFTFFKIKTYKLNHFNCDGWIKGFNNTLIDNESKKYPCKIKFPKSHSCYLKEIGPYFDLTTKYKLKCSNRIYKIEKEYFLKDMQNLKFSNISEKNHIGFPLTNTDEIDAYEYGCYCYKGIKNIQNYIYDNIIFMDLYYKNKRKFYPNVSHPEIEVVLNNEWGKIIINVHKNKTLIKEREKIISKIQNKPMYSNVLVMFFDTLSRAHFFRKFPKTIKFLNRFFEYETKREYKSMTAFQYLKYHSLNTYTDPNLLAAYYGADLFGNGTHFAKYFKDNGYIIGRLNGLCEKENIVNVKNPKALTHIRFDHEGVSLECIKTFFKGMLVSSGSSLAQKCLFRKDINEYALEYLESFWLNYFEQQKLFIINTIDGHEPTGELIGHFDEPLYNFFNKFHTKSYFNETSIIIFSDHGMHINGPLYLFDSQDFFIERTLSLLILIIPNNEKLYKNNLYEKIKSNQQTFVTPFDIFNTFIYLADGENSINYVSYGESLFNEMNYNERFCQSDIYKSQISIKYCSCQLQK